MIQFLKDILGEEKIDRMREIPPEIIRHQVNKGSVNVVGRGEVFEGCPFVRIEAIDRLNNEVLAEFFYQDHKPVVIFSGNLLPPLARDLRHCDAAPTYDYLKRLANKEHCGRLT